MVWFSEDKLGNMEDDRWAGVVERFCPGETKIFSFKLGLSTRISSLFINCLSNLPINAGRNLSMAYWWEETIKRRERRN